MKIEIAALTLIASLVPVRADQMIENVQQALKDQGFYYGEISGDTNASTTAAIRRYQIRNGLQVTGELNEETLKSLGVNSSGSGREAMKPGSPTPDAAAKANQSTTDEADSGTGEPPIRNSGSSPQDQQLYPSTPTSPASELGALFAGTPFETAPPMVQRNVVVSAQIGLARNGMYRQQIDGIYGPKMELSLRAYQARMRLPVTGRLDLETLARLRLLPAPGRPFRNPYRQHMHAPYGPPVPQWIPQ